MKKNIIKEKSEAFGVRIIKLSRYLKSKKTESVLCNQVLKSGTSIAANIAEATAAISRAEFSVKMSISYKEANETLCWLKLLAETNSITQEQFASLEADGTELIKILYSILKTTRMGEKK
jgi:four helix bundle protein